MEILLDRLEGDAWRAIDPGLVLERSDRVRFRFRTNFDGYLYVLNQSTSGKYEQLFPRQETGQNNRIEAGKQYQVPAQAACPVSLARQGRKSSTGGESRTARGGPVVASFASFGG
jgi:hypothetical protein